MGSADLQLLCTVSTVKDTRANIEQFVTSNLTSGADHMFVFLESDDTDVRQYLESHPDVTAVRTDDAYWDGTRPDELIQRQLVNANLVNVLLTPLPSVGWLAHLDGDECLEIDKDELARLPSDVRAVRLGTREAVSTEHGTRDVTQFKRKLGPKQLERLVRLGVLSEPSNRLWLKGYLIGKSVARPALDLGMGIHRASGRDGSDLEHHRAGAFRVLHYDCVSFDEFVRKWTSHVTAGGSAFRDERLVLLRTVEALVEDPSLTDEQRREAMRTLYKERVEDPVDLLEDSGLLQAREEAWHSSTPQPFPAADAEDRDTLLPLLLAADKRIFRQRHDALASIAGVREVAALLGEAKAGLRDRVESAATEAEARLAAPAS